MPRAIVLVPGFWEGPGSYEPLKATLEAALDGDGVTVHSASLRSTGTKPPGNPTLSDDIASLHSQIEEIVEKNANASSIADQEVNILLVLHSAAGFIGSNAMQGLGAPERVAAGKRGGVARILFLAAGVAPLGSDQFGGPFIIDQDDGTCVCRDSISVLFHDLPASEAEKWQSKLDSQPTVDNWKSPITYCGWRHVPSAYVICEGDRLLPAELQEKMAGFAGSDIVRLDAGHMAHLSKTQELADVIVEQMKKL
ncbi:alpha/beta-hydrolase [Xylariaceae sp. FL0255]|nr:alpha/beta-hydrolase [Xylariaceae sp. FL0255]